MTVPTTSIVAGPYTGNGVTDTFDYNWTIWQASELILYQTDTSGNVTTLTEGTDYTVNGVGSTTGRTVTLTNPLPSGYTLLIKSNFTPTQETDFVSQGSFYPQVHEDALDKLTYLLQQVIETDTRTLTLSPASTGVNTTLPDPVPNHILGWDASGTSIINSSTNIAGKADKVTGATSGHVATLDANGNLLDSGGAPGPGGGFDADTVDGKHASQLLLVDVNGMSALRAITPTAGAVVRLRYHTTDGDGGHGVFRAVTGAVAGTYTDDNGVTIVPAGGDGSAAWVRDYAGAVSVKWYGAVGDGVADDSAAFLSASQHLSIFIPEGVYRVTQPITVKSFQSWLGEAPASNSTTSGAVGGAKIVVDTPIASLFTAPVQVKHASISCITITVTASVTNVFDFKELVGCDFSDIDVESSNNTTGGFLSRKTTGVSWANTLSRVRIKLPRTATAYVVDLDFSDTPMTACTFSGGLGVIDRATGGNRYVACHFNQTSSSGAGLTASIETESGWQSQILGCEFEENDGADIVINCDADNTLTNTIIGFQIVGNHFRSAAAPHSIHIVNTTGNVLRNGVISNNAFLAAYSGVDINVDASRFSDIQISGNTHRIRNYNRVNAGMSLNANVAISAGAIQINGSRVVVGTEFSSTADDLDTITGGFDGDIIILETISTSRVVTVRHAVGNIVLAGAVDCVLSKPEQKLQLIYNAGSGNWEELSRAL